MAAFYTFSDLSGLASASAAQYDTPYDVLLSQCKTPQEIQDVYARHRINRNAQQKEKLLSKDFQGVVIDEILARLETERGYTDPRNCLVFWARPTAKIKTLIDCIQVKLRAAVPNLWTMPQDCLHMTALEVTHSLTREEIDQLVERLGSKAAEIADFTMSHRAGLVKPLVSFDAQAMALSFLPAAAEPGSSIENDAYSYHHLRRDLYTEVKAAGVDVASRYVVPSAHLTLGRFITTADFQDSTVQHLVTAIEDINVWLQKDYWPGRQFYDRGGEWIVGEEKGLTYRKGTLWYGAGDTVYQGRGFQ